MERRKKITEKSPGKGWVLLSLLFFCGAAARGQESNPGSPVIAGPRLQINGLAHFRYSSFTGDGEDGFSLKRMRLWLSGELARNISLKLLVDFVRSPGLVEAQIDLSLTKALGLRVGQFKVPFSLESLTSGMDRELINLSQVVATLSPGRDIGSLGRDIGAAARVKTKAAEFMLGAFNGSGINKLDADGHMDIAGRVVVSPASRFSIGISRYDGKRASASGVAAVARDRTGLECFYGDASFSLKAEYIAAVDGRTKAQGWYVQTGYFFISEKVQALFRYDALDPNTDVAANRSDVFTLGASWFFSPKTKLQLNYEVNRLQSGKIVNKSLLAQFQAGF